MSQHLRLKQTRRSQMQPLRPMSDSTHTIDDNLSRFGFTVVGEIDSKLIANVKRHLESPAIKQRDN
jgi:hypothetical protein